MVLKTFGNLIFVYRFADNEKAGVCVATLDVYVYT